MTSFLTIREVSQNTRQFTDPGIDTGISEFRRYDLRIRPGTITVVGSRPRVGRTTFLLYLFTQINATSGIPQCFISNEDPEEEIFLRMASVVTGKRIRHWQGDDPGVRAVDLPILNSDRDFIITRHVPWEELKTDIETLYREKGVSVFYIDKIQSLSSSKRFNNREQELAHIVRELKLLAGELGISFLVASTLSRSVDFREGKMPQLSDLRESGSIEDYCDIIMLLYRPVVYGITEDENGNSLVNHSEVILAKNRFGPSGCMRFSFNPLVPRFEKFVDARTYNYPARFDDLSSQHEKEKQSDKNPF